MSPGILTETEILRYQRQISLPEFGLQGQAKLKKSAVLIVGVGGLGTPAAQYLAAAGVGRLGLVDPDVVEVHNLQRQILYATADAAKPKVQQAADRLRAMNPEVQIDTHAIRLDATNAAALIAKYDVIVDGTDHLGSRQIINRACVALKKPLVYGALFRFEGVASVFCANLRADARDVPCYACLYGAGETALGVAADCETAGVLGVLPGVIGTIQATETIKLLCDVGEPLVGRLLQYDALSMRMREWAVPRDPDCAVCGNAMNATAPDENIPAEKIETKSSGTPAIPDAKDAAKIDDSNLPPEISVRQLQALLAGPGTIQLLDVREAHELEISALPNAIVIPVGQLADRLQELSRETQYAVFCKSGGRSARAVALLRSQGFTRIANVRGGINAWAREIDPQLPEY